jgi:fused signal recognition particle receptor
VFQKKKTFFGRLQERIEEVILSKPSIDESVMEDLEEILITADIGLMTAEKIIETLRSDVKDMRIRDAEGIKERIKEIICDLMDKGEAHKLSAASPLIVLVIGVNGSGKTTSIAKLAHAMQQEGRSVLLAAGDTFRAAASEQLQIWGDRLGVSVIKQGEGADPSAVIYDAIKAAKAREIDVLICDTAGRLQTKKNLMEELAKMSRIIDREYPEAEKETLLVLDAATGKNAVSQAEEFTQASPVSGIILTKLDGTAKGGIVVTVADMFQIPVKYIGVGEKMEDLVPFDAMEFSENIFQQPDTP